MTTRKEFFRRLIEALRLLSASYDVQKSSLPDFVHVPDELALIFDDCFLLIQQFIETEKINDDQITKLRAIDQTLHHMTKSRGVWTLEGLETMPEWQEVRYLARLALDSFSKTYKSPDLYWLQYVK